ncbi:MAG TPA: hypothetical protein VLA12_04585, partial [Planctomycetaceae bacterium]|nr:hypothetical protein [Planctomycetaceae bacterium]
ENQILSATINLPLDPSQQTNASKVIKLQLERGFAHVDADKEATDEQKAAVKKAMSLAGDAIETTLKEHGLDGFAYCKPNPSGKHTLLGGLVMSKPENLTELFKLMPSFPKPRKIAMEVEKQGEVAIHEFEFSEASQAAMLDFFGAGKMYVGVGPKVAWFALGDNALADLKAAVEATAAAAEQAPSPQFFSFSIKGAPWVGWHDRHDKQPAPALKKTIKQVAGTNGEEKPDTKQKLSSIPIRQLAIEAFDEGNDVLSMSLRKDDDRIKGDLKADTGLLRFIGKALASFSKDTLEE